MLYSLYDTDIGIKIYHKKSLTYSVELSRQFCLLFNGHSLQVVLLFQTLSREPSKGQHSVKKSHLFLPSSAQEASVITAQLVSAQTLSETNT